MRGNFRLDKILWLVFSVELVDSPEFFFGNYCGFRVCVFSICKIWCVFNIFVYVVIGEIASNMRGRSYSYSPSPSPPRRYSRRRHSLSPRGRYRGCDRDLPTSLLVRNLNRDCRYVCQWRIFALAVVFSVYLQWLFVLLLCGSGLWVFFLCCLLMFLLYVMEA